MKILSERFQMITVKSPLNKKVIDQLLILEHVSFSCNRSAISLVMADVDELEARIGPSLVRVLSTTINHALDPRAQILTILRFYASNAFYQLRYN
jgi:hypothetical protein